MPSDPRLTLRPGKGITILRTRFSALRHLGIKNAIRPSALGKKNWLFIGHPTAGERSAVIYTLLGSCRRQGINPFEYLKDLFTRLPAAKITQIEQFTPRAWAKAKAVPLARAA